MVAMNYNLNRGLYKSLESKWAAILSADKNAKVNVNISCVYSGNSMRPTGLIVKYSVNGNAAIPVSFMNEYEGGK